MITRYRHGTIPIRLAEQDSPGRITYAGHQMTQCVREHVRKQLVVRYFYGQDCRVTALTTTVSRAVREESPNTCGHRAPGKPGSSACGTWKVPQKTDRSGSPE